MSSDHQMLLQLEQVAADQGLAPKILDDLGVVCPPAIRVMLMAFEEDSYDAHSPGGRHLLRGLLETFPDSKIVEDIHGTLRKSVKKGVNQRQTLGTLQELVINSPVLSSREIPHKAEVTRDVFLASFPRSRDRKRKRPVTCACQKACNTIPKGM